MAPMTVELEQQHALELAHFAHSATEPFAPPATAVDSGVRLRIFLWPRVTCSARTAANTSRGHLSMSMMASPKYVRNLCMRWQLKSFKGT